jgi:DNA-binding transcriptional LysR family regulator
MFPHVSTEALVCAVVLSEEGNLGRTAERLHTSNSNVGRKVKILQDGWGIAFFRRTITGFELTEEGRSAIREVRKSHEYAQLAFDRALYITVKNRRPFRIGHSLYIHGKILPFLEKQTTPGTDFSRIVLKADTTLRLKARVLRGDLHMAFGVMPIFDKDLWVAPVAHENFSVCIPENHPFRDKARLSAHELTKEKLYWMPRFVHPPLYDQVTAYLSGVGHDLHNLHEARAIIQGIDLAAAKLGVALVSQSAARFQCPGVLFKPLTDKLSRIETALFVRRDQMHGEVQDFVNSMLAELNPPKIKLA